MQRAEELAIRSGDPKAVIDAQLFKSQTLAERGDLDTAVALARDGAARATAIGATMCVVAGNMFTGLLELARDRADAALEPLQISYDIANENQFVWWQNISEAGLSSARCNSGDIDLARAGWDKTLARPDADRDRGTEALILGQRAKMLAQTPSPDWSAVAADLQRVAALHHEIGARPREAHARHDLARAFENLGRHEEAMAEEARAKELFAAIGMAAPAAAPTPAP
jgi:hypothetical protein